MIAELRRAAAEGRATRLQREEAERQRRLELFWTTVAQAETWIRTYLPASVRDAVAMGNTTVQLKSGPGGARPEGYPISFYWELQARANGIEFDRGVSRMRPYDSHEIELPVAQFLEAPP